MQFETCVYHNREFPRGVTDSTLIAQIAGKKKLLEPVQAAPCYPWHILVVAWRDQAGDMRCVHDPP